MKTFSFHKSLKGGQVGEALLLKTYPDILERLDGRENDFRINKNNRYLELKTDYYPQTETPNFFMERFSYESENGGPWQAKENGNYYFLYMFIKDKNLFLFNTDELVFRLDSIIKEFKIKDIKNYNHTTRGYAISREIFKDIYLEFKLGENFPI